jgi:hypothetical protein
LTFMSSFPSFHILKKICDSCLSESGLFHLTLWSPFLFIFLQRTLFHSSLWMNNTQLCIYHIFFIHFSLNVHLGWFHSLAIVNSVMINIGMQE